MRVLTLNAGSNSLKFEIISETPNSSKFGSVLISGTYDGIGKEDSTFSLLKSKQTLHQEKVVVHDYHHAAELLLDWIDQGKAKASGIHSLKDIDRVGHRIVHGGALFNGPAFITDHVIEQIESLEDLAPLHNASALKAIHAARSRPGFSAPMVAVVDTVFHQTIPDEAALYPIPLELSDRYKIRRYGFHGISHRYMATRYSQIVNRPVSEMNLITLHLEGGSSACAIRNGKSMDTSMGFTPLEGLMMGTRCGDIDPALVTYLMRKNNLDSLQMETFLNKECGLLGVSGKSADTRKLAELTSDKQVQLALQMFCYRVRKYVGAYLAIPGPTEAILIGGGIGENQPALRELIFRDFAFCDSALDLAQNARAVDTESLVSTPESNIAIWVIPTQENLMMSKDIAAMA